MPAAEIVGLIAGLLTTASFLPQVLKTWRSKSARDISFAMFAIFSVGVLLWMVYGALIGSLPVIIANGVTFVLASSVLAFKVRYK